MPFARPTTLADRAAQLVFARLGSNMPPPTPVSEDADRVAALLERCALGGLVLFNGRWPETPAFLAELQRQSRFPLLIATDMERGVGQQMAGATVFPHARAFAAVPDAEAHVEAAARIAAREALACGLHITFAPVADVNRDPRNPIIATRAFGSEAATAARLVRAYLRGCHAEGLLATAKHFPGHGNTAADSHAERPLVPDSRDELDRHDLVPFRAAIEEGVDLVMTAHVRFPALDPEARAATFSPPILRGLLRDELGFGGVVITDSLLMGAVRAEEAAAGAQAAQLVNAGVDVLLDVPFPEASVAGIVRAVEAGTLAEARLDEAVGRVWALKEKLAARHGAALFTNPAACVPEAVASVGGAAHRQAADAVARGAVTLLHAAPDAWPFDAGDGEGLFFVLVESHRGRPIDAEVDLRAAVRAAFPRADYAEVGPDTDAETLDRLRHRAASAWRVVAAVVVKPAAWHAFGLPPALAAFVGALARHTHLVLGALGSAAVLGDYPEAAVHLCTYSDVAASRLALVETLAAG